MGRFRLTLLTASLALGCVGTYEPAERLTERNRRGFALLGPGMSRDQVEDVMGSRTYFIREGPGQRRLRVGNPYRRIAAELPGIGSLDVLYYYTGSVHADGVLTDEELTPLVLEDETLVAWGPGVLDTLYGPAVKHLVAADVQQEIMAERSREEGQHMEAVAEEVLRDAIWHGSFLIHMGTIGY